MAGTPLRPHTLSLRWITALVVAFVVQSATAGATGVNKCEALFADLRSQTHMELVAKYATLDFLIKDPDAFLSRMRDRFEKQKRLTPDDPHSFDYTDVAMPVMRDMVKDLDSYIKHLDSELTKSETSLNPFKKFRAENLRISLRHAKLLRLQGRHHIDRGEITYKDSIEYSFFYSRLRGQYDTEGYGLMSRFLLGIDRRFNGYKQLSPQAELDMYLRPDFKVFASDKMHAGFKEAALLFTNAFQNKTTLETVFIPTNAEVDRDIFYYLMTKNVHLSGITPTPLLADGVNRPSGDFWNHDLRHESVKFQMRLEYILKHGLSEKQIAAFEKQSQVWYAEYNQELAKVKDKDLREAIDLLHFNFIHDRGYVMAPSSFLGVSRASRIGFTYGLSIMMKASGQGVPFKKLLPTLRHADTWLIEFWQKRMAEEDKIILQP